MQDIRESILKEFRMKIFAIVSIILSSIAAQAVPLGLYGIVAKSSEVEGALGRPHHVTKIESKDNEPGMLAGPFKFDVSALNANGESVTISIQVFTDLHGSSPVITILSNNKN